MLRLLGLVFVVGALCIGCVSCSPCKDGKCPSCPKCQDYVEVDLPRNFLWKRHSSGQYWLYEDDDLRGAWLPQCREYVPWRGTTWATSAEDPPTSPPLEVGRAFTGVRMDKLDQTHEVISAAGQHVTKQEAIRLIGDTPDVKVPDDCQNFRVTIIGKDAAKRDALREEIRTGERWRKWQDFISVWSVGPEHWCLKCGFPQKTDGVVVQDCKGIVQWRQETLDADQLFGGLRKIIPDYNPKRDPGPGWSILNWLFPGMDAAIGKMWMIAAGVAGALILIFAPRNQPKGV